jgi:hypothetical protein
MDENKSLSMNEVEALVTSLHESFDKQLDLVNQLVIITMEISPSRRTDIIDGLENVRRTLFESTYTNI